MAKKAPLGTGQRFKACVTSCSKGTIKPRAGQTKVQACSAVCAAAGRKKFSKAGFAKLAAAGRKRAK